MNIGSFLDKFLDKRRENKREIKEMHQHIRNQKFVEARMKSSDERELDTMMEEERQKRIKMNLQALKKHRAKQEYVNRNSILKSPNIFKEKKKLFLNKNNMFLNKGGLK